jgi:hypothetical protein
MQRREAELALAAKRAEQQQATISAHADKENLWKVGGVFFFVCVCVWGGGGVLGALVLGACCGHLVLIPFHKFRFAFSMRV